MNYPSITIAPSLPIAEFQEEIRKAIAAHQVTIVVGETGSGKTTQLPKLCLQAGRRKIACTQPRRIAAFSVSRRIAEELNVSWGKEVGCKVRFKDHTDPRTVIKVMTDGMLLAELQQNRALSEYDTVIIDEAHERSLNIDFLLGYLRSLLPKRPDLKVVITSATIDAPLFQAHFGGAPLIEVPGRLFPVDIWYRPEYESEALEESVLTAVEEIRKNSHEGDVLIFLPTERDIREAAHELRGAYKDRYEIIPLFGRLTAQEQDKAFSSSSKRKIVLATNIAETSLTIPGIRFVVDTGLHRISRYSTRTRTTQLPVEPIAQSNATQRAGRAGRVEEGVCIRLYSEEELLERPEFTPPEILRSNLAQVILRMRALKLGDIEEFPFVTPPPPQAVKVGLQQLYELGALNEEKELTRQGHTMAKISVDPPLSRMLLEAEREGVFEEVLLIAAVLSIQDPREYPFERRGEAQGFHRSYAHPASDFLTLLHLWSIVQEEKKRCGSTNAFRKYCRSHFLAFHRIGEWEELAEELRQQFHAKEKRKEVRFNPAQPLQERDLTYGALHRALLSGYLGQIALKTEANKYKMSYGREVQISRSSALFEDTYGKPKGAGKPQKEQWIMAAQLVETEGIWVHSAAKIQPAWLEHCAPHLIKSRMHEVFWSTSSGEARVAEDLTLFGLTIGSRSTPVARKEREKAHDLFVEHALVRGETRESFLFIKKNLALLEKVEHFEDKTRTYSRAECEDRLQRFYHERLPGITSVRELKEYLRLHKEEGLLISEDELTGGGTLALDESQYPTRLKVGMQEIPLEYTFAPGKEEDGVTVRLPFNLLRSVEAYTLESAVPAYHRIQVEGMLKSLPKEARQKLFPFDRALDAVLEQINEERPLRQQVAEVLEAGWGITLSPEALVPPVHTLPRYQITAPDGSTVLEGKSLSTLQEQAEGIKKIITIPQALRIQHESPTLQSWPDQGFPHEVVCEPHGVLWRGLSSDERSVRVSLFIEKKEAEEETRKALLTLLKGETKTSFAALLKNLSSFGKDFSLLTKGYSKELAASLEKAISSFLFTHEVSFPLTEAQVKKCGKESSARIQILGTTLDPLVQKISPLLGEVRTKYPFFLQERSRVADPSFLKDLPLPAWQELPRYLKGLLIRGERRMNNLQKDHEKFQSVRPFEEKLSTLLKKEPLSAVWESHGRFIEEFHLMVFAPEVGTSCKVSEKILHQVFTA